MCCFSACVFLRTIDNPREKREKTKKKQKKRRETFDSGVFEFFSLLLQKIESTFSLSSLCNVFLLAVKIHERLVARF